MAAAAPFLAEAVNLAESEVQVVKNSIQSAPLWSSVVQNHSVLTKHELQFSVSEDGTSVVEVPNEVFQN